MDKRLFLALLLTAIVVVLTPIVFPTPRPVPRRAISDTTGAGTQATQPIAGTTTGVTAPAIGTTGGTAGTIGVQRRGAVDTAARTAVMPVTAETTRVEAGGS